MSRASAGWRRTSPASSAPYTACQSSRPRYRPPNAAHENAPIGVSSNPSRAYRIASRARSPNGRVPHRSSRSNQPAIAPGTVTECGPTSSGIVAQQVAYRARASALAGDRPGSEVAVQLAVPDDREEVAAVSAEVRRNHTEREVGRDDRVDRVPAAGELGRARAGREVVRGGETRRAGSEPRRPVVTPARRRPLRRARARQAPLRRRRRCHPSPGPRAASSPA